MVYVCTHMCDYTHVLWCSCGGWRTTCGVVLYFYHVSPRDWTQVLRLGEKFLCLMSHVSKWKCFIHYLFWSSWINRTVIIFYYFGEGVSCIPGRPWSHYVGKDDLDLLFLSPKFQNYRGTSPYSVHCGAGDVTQGFVNSRQVLYQLSYTLTPKLKMNTYSFCKTH